ncbi:MAG: glycosyltransferase, partial [Planctomycetales bacterium]|nr:glycosyltransferase [Planctomycetales bacterium]NIP70953.1 glycosyltransferase [Planctomycetales bacterium]
VIFVEGGSQDGTWEEIERVGREVVGPYPIRAFQQPGQGKCDAVRHGFAQARNELLVILDADMTMPPEL